MNINKVILSIVLIFTISASLISGVSLSAVACDCGEYHEAPFHVGDDIISLAESNSGNGWQWSHNARTLTLTNANISNTVPEPFDPSYPGEKRPETPGKYMYDKVENSVIFLPPNSTIILNGNNTVTPVEDDSMDPFYFAIHGVGSTLTIKGGGSLHSKGLINVHRLVFDSVNVTIDENQKVKHGGIFCYELHIKNSTVKNNARTNNVAALNINNGVLYTKNTEGGEMPGAIYFFKNYDTSRFDVKYKTATGYDGETVGGNKGEYATFFKKIDGAQVEATDIMIKGKSSANNKPVTSTTSKVTNSTSSKQPNSSEKIETNTSSTTVESQVQENEVVIDKGNVSVKYHSNVFPTMTIISIASVESGDAYQMTKQALSEVSSKFLAYDINAKDNDVKVQPDGTVTVAFDIPKDYDIDKTAIYYVSEDGYEKIPSEVDRDEYIIRADLSHFSIYAVVEENVLTAQAEKKEFEYKYIVIAVAAVLVTSLAGVFVYRKQKMNKVN